MYTKKLLETISVDCSAQLTKYKFNKGLDISDKYRRGKIASLQYVLDLIYHFYEKDKQMKIEFENLITSQMDDISKLKNGDYKKGVNEVLSWTKIQLVEKSKK